MNTNWLERPVFIISIGKTGTTLLIALFDGHEEMVVIPEETDYFDAVHTPVSLILRSPFLEGPEKIDRITNLWLDSTHIKLLNGTKREKSFARDNLDYTNFDFVKFKGYLKQFMHENKLDHKTVLESIPYSYARTIQAKGNVSCWLEKTPFHEFNVTNKIPFLERIFPQAKFIHLYRHPLDNFIAFNKKDREKWHVMKFVFDLKRSLSITKANLQKDNHILLRYEDLVREPNSTLKLVTEFLDISYSSVLFSPTKNGTSWQGNSVENNQFRGISTSSCNKHLGYENKQELASLEFLLKNEMSFLGYEFNYSHTNLTKTNEYLTYAPVRNIGVKYEYLKHLTSSMKHNFFQ